MDFLSHELYLSYAVIRLVLLAPSPYVQCRVLCCRRFGTKCGGCSLGISPNDLVRRARNKVFHLKCFTCVMCRKQLSTGEELYVIDENRFICKEDYLNSRYGSTGKCYFFKQCDILANNNDDMVLIWASLRVYFPNKERGFFFKCFLLYWNKPSMSAFIGQMVHHLVFRCLRPSALSDSVTR